MPIVVICATFKFTARRKSEQKDGHPIQFTPAAEDTTDQFDREDPETKDLPTEGMFIMLQDRGSTHRTIHVMLVNTFDLPLLRQNPLKALASTPTVIDTLCLSQAAEIPPSTDKALDDPRAVYTRPVPCNPMHYIKDSIVLASRISVGDVARYSWGRQNLE
ncbi:hypothetical protein DL95DRAFT_416883 [Leptodontidium sp. 2 PMI_412]|nr:hypothetical protein DL95DRAFT_416883 [Leptodontidium sp. 2 PMI_412]